MIKIYIVFAIAATTKEIVTPTGKAKSRCTTSAFSAANYLQLLHSARTLLFYLLFILSLVFGFSFFYSFFFLSQMQHSSPTSIYYVQYNCRKSTLYAIASSSCPHLTIFTCNVIVFTIGSAAAFKRGLVAVTANHNKLYSRVETEYVRMYVCANAQL